MSRLPTSFICIAKGKNDHLKREEDQSKTQNTPQRSYSISSSYRVIIRELFISEILIKKMETYHYKEKQEIFNFIFSRERLYMDVHVT